MNKKFKIITTNSNRWFGHEPTRTKEIFRIKGSCSLCGSWFKIFVFLFFIPFCLFAQQNQNTEAARRDIIQYGTESEIASLIQTLRNEKEDYLDDELLALAQTSRNTRILIGIFNFFGEREKNGLEARAIKIINEREDETNDTVNAAIDYLGRIKSANAVPVIISLLDSEERRFYNIGFRALGRAGSANRRAAEEAVEFLMNFYENRDPGADNRREIIVAIGATGVSAGIDFLSEIAGNDDERAPLRMAALEALSKIGDSKGLDAILKCVSSNDPNIRSAAVGALGPFRGRDVENAILDGLRDSYYRTRLAAAAASRERRLVAAVPFLKFRAERDDVPNVRDEAVRALGEIATSQANEALESLLFERRNPDRIRILAAEMLMQNDSDTHFDKLVIEMDEAKRRNQTALYNGLLKAVGETTIQGDKTNISNITRRLITTGTVIEKLYALDMIANNNLSGFETQINTLAEDRNEGIARRARRTLEALEEYKTGQRVIKSPRREQAPVEPSVQSVEQLPEDVQRIIEQRNQAIEEFKQEMLEQENRNESEEQKTESSEQITEVNEQVPENSEQGAQNNEDETDNNEQ